MVKDPIRSQGIFIFKFDYQKNMQPVSYLNLYITVVVGFVLSMAFGSYFFYQNMDNASFLLLSGLETNRIYIDQHQYNSYLQGFIYCMTFFVAGVLLLIVMALPSKEVFEQRAIHSGRLAPSMTLQTQEAHAPSAIPAIDASQMGTSQSTPTTSESSNPQEVEDPSQVQLTIEDEPDIDLFEAEDDSKETADANVVYGLGRVTEDSTLEFIHAHPDSAVKFLYRRNLEGKSLSSAEEKIYESWQKRGLTRTRVRDYILQLMEWKKLPEVLPLEIWSQLRDQIFELTH